MMKDGPARELMIHQLDLFDRGVVDVKQSSTMMYLILELERQRQDLEDQLQAIGRKAFWAAKARR